MKGKQNFAIVNVNNNTMPIINEDSKTRYAWIPFGVYGHDDFFAAVTTAYNVSTTNAACVEGLADLIYIVIIYFSFLLTYIHMHNKLNQHHTIPPL